MYTTILILHVVIRVLSFLFRFFDLPVVDHKFTLEENGEQFVPPRNRYE